MGYRYEITVYQLRKWKVYGILQSQKVWDLAGLGLCLSGSVWVLVWVGCAARG